MRDPTRSEFYWEPTFRCAVHPSKPSGFVVKRGGEEYRQACDEKCAMTQALELDQAWNPPEDVR